jgi:hypothetical protein
LFKLGRVVKATLEQAGRDLAQGKPIMTTANLWQNSAVSQKSSWAR